MWSIGDFLDAFGFENLLLMATFIISFALFSFALNKTLFKREGNKTLPAIIGFVLAMLLTYFVHTTGFDLENFLFNLGLDSALLTNIIYVVIAIGILYLLWKIGRRIILYLGLMIIIVSIMGWVYETTITFLLGAILLVIYFFIRKKKPRRTKINTGPSLFSRRSKHAPIPTIENVRRQEYRNGTLQPTTRSREREDKQRQYEADQARRREKSAKQEAEDTQEELSYRQKNLQKIRDQLIEVQTKMQRIVDRLTPIEKEYQAMEAPLQRLGNEAGKLGWTKGGLTEIPGEDPKQREARAKAARNAYKKWVKELNKRDALRKEIKQLTKEHENLTPKYKKLNDQYTQLYERVQSQS